HRARGGDVPPGGPHEVGPALAHGVDREDRPRAHRAGLGHGAAQQPEAGRRLPARRRRPARPRPVGEGPAPDRARQPQLPARPRLIPRRPTPRTRKAPPCTTRPTRAPRWPPPPPPPLRRAPPRWRRPSTTTSPGSRPTRSAP